MLSPLIFIFQRNDSLVLEKDIPGLCNWQDAFKKIYIPKGQRIYNFLKRKQSKREVRAWSQEEAFLNSSQAEGNVQALFLRYHNIHYLHSLQGYLFSMPFNSAINWYLKKYLFLFIYLATPSLRCSMQTLSYSMWGLVPRPGRELGPPALGE